MSHCSPTVSSATASITSIIAEQRGTRNPGTSTVLSGSTTRSRPAALNSRAANLRFVTRIARNSARSSPGFAIPAMQLSFGTPSACAYAMPRATPWRNSSSRPGRHAMPKSPFARSPMGRLTRMQASALSVSRAAISAAGRAYGAANSTAENPARRAGSKRSRNACSGKRKPRLAAKRGTDLL